MAGLLNLVKTLVSIDSTSSREKRITDFIQGELLKRGVKALRVKNNLVSDLKTEVTLVGHLDCVAPFYAPRVKGSKIIGRGACDMKSGLAVMIELSQKVNTVFYSGEETPLPNGLTQILEKNLFPKTNLAIVLEPTDLRVQVGCHGRILAKKAMKTRGGHAALAQNSQNAIEKIRPFIKNFARRTPSRPALGFSQYETLATTKISAGEAANQLPQYAELFLDYRFPTYKTIAQAKKTLRQKIGDYECLDKSYSSLLPTSQILRVKKLFPNQKIEVMRAWSDIAQLQENKISAVNFGPGKIECAHSSNEWVDCRQVVKCKKILEELIT